MSAHTYPLNLGVEKSDTTCEPDTTKWVVFVFNMWTRLTCLTRFAY